MEGKDDQCPIVSLCSDVLLLRWRLAQKDMLQKLALAGPAADLRNALLRRWFRCYVTDCVWPERKESRHGKKWPDTHSFPQGQLARCSCITLHSLLMISILTRICIHVVSDCAQTRLNPSTSLSLAGWPLGCWERGTGVAAIIISLDSYTGGGPEACLEGHAAAAGSCRTCCRSQESSAPSPSRCNVAHCVWTQRKKTRLDVAHWPCTIHLWAAGWLGWSRENLQLLQNASAVGLLQAFCVYLWVSIYRWSQSVHRPWLDYSLLSHHLWPACLWRYWNCYY